MARGVYGPRYTRDMPSADLRALRRELDSLAAELGFSALGVAHLELAEDEQHLLHWLQAGRHGDMHYMARHGTRRSRPAELRPGTICAISVRLDYWPAAAAPAESVLARHDLGYVSRYALARDYHKIMRNALQDLADRIEVRVGKFGYRVYVDSGPVLEKALARNAGLGWIGKHTNLIARDAGSWFFFGRDLHRSAAADRPRRSRTLWQLRGLHARLPDRRHHRTLRTRCATLHKLSHHRTARRDPDRSQTAAGESHLRL